MPMFSYLLSINVHTFKCMRRQFLTIIPLSQVLFIVYRTYNLLRCLNGLKTNSDISIKVVLLVILPCSWSIECIDVYLNGMINLIYFLLSSSRLKCLIISHETCICWIIEYSPSMLKGHTHLVIFASWEILSSGQLYQNIYTLFI